MKIMAVPTYNLLSTQLDNKNSQSNISKNNTLNSPSFKSFLIDDAFKIVRKSLEETRYQELKDVKNFLKDDVKILSKRMGKSEEQISDVYGDYLKTGGLNSDKGLNTLIGYPLQKLKLIKDVTTPIVKKLTNKPTGAPVPNGVIISGNGIDNEKAAEALLKHLDGIDPKREIKINDYKSERVPFMHNAVAEGDWKAGDTDANIEALSKPFEFARVDNERFGSHSAILVKNVDEIFSSENTDMLKLALKYQTKNAANNGVTWVITTKNPDKLPKWLTQSNKSVSVDIGEIKSDFDKSLVLKSSIAEAGRRDKSNHEELFAYMRLRKFPQSQNAISDMVKSVDKMLDKKDSFSYTYGRYTASFNNKNLMNGIDNYKK